MSLNWIHTSVYAPKPILEELHTALKPHVHKADDLSINIDKEGKPYLFTDTWEKDALNKNLEDISKKHPTENIGVRYMSSSPGAYHEIKTHYLNGQETVDSDKVDRVLDLEEDMNKCMDPESTLG